MYHNYFGIDIGKFEFVANRYGETATRTYSNNKPGFKQFIKDYRKELDNSMTVLETTGGYEMAFIEFLMATNHTVHRANALRVKNFIRSRGTYAKSDAIDARGLACYSFERHRELMPFKEHEYRDLLQFINRRNELTDMLIKEKNRLQAPDHDIIKSSYKRSIKQLQAEIKRIDAKIKLLNEKDTTLADKREVLKKVSGIGDITAYKLLANMPELGKINHKKIASLGGVAPHDNQSGTYSGYQRMRGGRRQVKAFLFMAAMAAAHSKSDLGEKYQKLVANGKKKMVALGAIMRIILVRANAKMRDYYLEQELKDQSKENLETNVAV